MKKLWVFGLTALMSVSAFAQKEGCGDSVDMADSLDFQKMHVDCANDPVTLYDPDSKNGFLSRSSKTVTVYSSSDTEGAVSVKAEVAGKSVLQHTAEPIQQAVAARDNAGVIFNIREPFTLTGGPQSALNGLFVQMAQYCPSGWSKEKEWVVPAAEGYYLHYQFQCAN